MDFISILSIFVLACFVGYYVVWSVTPALHTPLMAVTNAISSVIIVGALIAAAKNAGKPVVVDPKGTDYARYRGASLLSPNRNELAQASGMKLDDDDAVGDVDGDTCGVIGQRTCLHLPATCR